MLICAKRLNFLLDEFTIVKAVAAFVFKERSRPTPGGLRITSTTDNALRVAKSRGDKSDDNCN